MRTFKLSGKLGKYDVTFPQSLEEISKKYFEECTNFVHPAPNYALVAVVYKDDLSVVITAVKTKKPTNISVVPVFIKVGATDDEFIKSLNIGDKIVVAASDLSIGHHINSPYNKLTPTNIASICDGDKDIYNTALKMQEQICMIEFKLIPINAIHAKLDTTKNSFINPFIRKSVDSKGEA